MSEIFEHSQLKVRHHERQAKKAMRALVVDDEDLAGSILESLSLDPSADAMFDAVVWWANAIVHGSQGQPGEAYKISPSTDVDVSDSVRDLYDNCEAVITGISNGEVEQVRAFWNVLDKEVADVTAAFILSAAGNLYKSLTIGLNAYLSA